MNISTIIPNGAAAICPHGDLDHEALPAPRAASNDLPSTVRSVTWVMDQVTFMDTAALHLLHEQQTSARRRARALFIRGVRRPQHHRLLALAASLCPAMNFQTLNI
ncbi:STAS domain-containing protein [Streptomyces sp. PTM05]|uniref:STAS domain-containing protein n=1 Tax=Streptantibioticus parmotrematis TaxID=2873249 RepID=A0ABS7R0G8_9ACTN|nr:STAS domain-containing protein [Streptantibioticus parmotrematis]MBY8888956.1 STAS domain-containing protein [Streptantibioticus parmotrematis]